ncbi:MAG: SDR family oxidoreductase [Asgard group archaeon]|nr:SDR family oxidoreductase [Asgard group archaeon]
MYCTEERHVNTVNDLSDKIVVITGATSGIGKEAAKELARMKATVVILARNMDLASKVKDEIEEYSSNTKTKFIQCDLSSLASVKTAAEMIKTNYPKIDVLFNNAGIFNKKRLETEDGFENTFGVNYLAHFYLTLLLIDNLKAGAPSRIINVSSNIHLFFGLKINDLQSEKRYRSQIAYANAKSAIVLFTYELHNRLTDTGITANVFHPGKVLTKMTTDSFPKFFLKLARGFLTPKQASESMIYIATSDELTNISGKYFQKSEIKKSSKQSYDKDLQKLLWDKSLEMIQEKMTDFQSIQL